MKITVILSEAKDHILEFLIIYTTEKGCIIGNESLYKKVLIIQFDKK